METFHGLHLYKFITYSFVIFPYIPSTCNFPYVFNVGKFCGPWDLLSWYITSRTIELDLDFNLFTLKLRVVTFTNEKE